MQVSVNPIQRNTSVAKIVKPAHGVSLPAGHVVTAVYIDSTTGDFAPADANNINEQKVMFVTKVIDANQVEVQHTGFFTSPAHGYLVGEYYFISNVGDGGFNVAPGVINDVGFYVVDNNVILLIDNRSI